MFAEQSWCIFQSHVQFRAAAFHVFRVNLFNLFCTKTYKQEHFEGAHNLQTAERWLNGKLRPKCTQSGMSIQGICQ